MLLLLISIIRLLSTAKGSRLTTMYQSRTQLEVSSCSPGKLLPKQRDASVSSMSSSLLPAYQRQRAPKNCNIKSS